MTNVRAEKDVRPHIKGDIKKYVKIKYKLKIKQIAVHSPL